MSSFTHTTTPFTRNRSMLLSDRRKSDPEGRSRRSKQTNGLDGRLAVHFYNNNNNNILQPRWCVNQVREGEANRLYITLL